MTLRIVALSLVLSATVAAFGGPARADDAPVTINSCTPNLSKDGPSIGGFSLGATSNGIAIEFVNTSSKTADLVNFAVDSNGTPFVIRDVGEFSPGVSIKHTYRNGAGQAFVLPQFIAPNVTCAVASVKFTDGTVWRRGQGTIPPAPGAGGGAPGNGTLSANPARIDIDRQTDSELFLVSSTNRVAAYRETDTCAGIAGVYVVATGQATATYAVRPLAPGTCAATVTDESGDTLAVPITIR